MDIEMHPATLIISAIIEVDRWCKEYKIPDDHGFIHALDVMRNASLALQDYDLEKIEELLVLLAALLHDINDRKYVPSENYEGVRMILSKIGLTSSYAEIVVTMINLVSCSKNGNTIDELVPKWYYIPRDADRLEALGYIGIKRAYETTIGFINQGKTPNRFWTDETIRCKNREELEITASRERLNEYTKIGKSQCFIDHFYDKLLHIKHLSSGSSSLQTIADQRHEIMVEFVIEFGINSTINWNRWLKET